jgi:hypothetical protein
LSAPTGNADYWRVIIASVAIIGIAATPEVVSPLRDSVSSLHIGDQLAVSGVVIALGGFSITLWQLALTKEATTAATKAVKTLKLRLQSLEDVVLCRESLTIVKEIARFQDMAMAEPSVGVSISLPERYRTLRLNLVELRERQDKHWDSEQRTIVQATVTNLIDAENSIIKFIVKPTRPFPNLMPLHQSIQVLSGMLTALSVSLDQVAIGGDDD